MKALKIKLRFSKKLLLIVGGLLALSGTSAAGYAFYKGGHVFSAGEPEKPSLSGLACTTLETVKIRRNGQRWIRKYVTVAPSDGVERMRTALRAAGLLVKAEKADLYQVVVLDPAGPTERASRRGAAIGAEVLFAPNPAIVPGMTTSFRARYSDGKPNMVGLFHAPEVELTMVAIQTTITAMTDVTDCAEPVVAAVEDETGHGDKKPASSHGEEAAPEGEGHGEEPASAHGEAATEPATDAHGNPVVAEGHEAPAGESAAKEGFFSSLTSMVLGKKTETASADAHPAADAPQGLIGSLKGMVFGKPAPAAEDASQAVPAGKHDASPNDTTLVAPANIPADHAAPTAAAPDHVTDTAAHEPAKDEAHPAAETPDAAAGH